VVVETRRQQIEDAASRLFRERGYAATSVRDIAQALNLQGGSLYAHVASKEDVLWSIVARAADRFRDEVGPAATRRAPAGDRLRDMIRRHVAVVTSAQRDAAVFLHEWRFLSPERREAIAARRDAYESLFREVIDEGVSAGEFVAIDPRLTAMAILSALNGMATWYRPDGPLSAQRIADQHADLFVRALAAPGHAPEPHFMTRTIR
jgi:AcrR family transcriptional regulator